MHKIHVTDLQVSVHVPYTFQQDHSSHLSDSKNPTCVYLEFIDYVYQH
jgi:hypothetical protein